MGSFGGMRPYPRKFGGGKSNVQVIFEGLAADRGTAFDALNPDTYVFAETLAYAKAIAGAWATNSRLGHLWDANRMGLVALERWEKILAIVPKATDTETYRRTQVARVMSKFGQPAVYGMLRDQLETACGDAFVEFEHNALADATINVPDGTYGFGTILSGRPWSSTVAHLKVQLQWPSGWTQGQVQESAKQVSLILDSELPAWCTYEWYISGVQNARLAVNLDDATCVSVANTTVQAALAVTLDDATCSSTATQ